MKKKSQKPCEVCKEFFDIKDLFPVGLIKNTMLSIAEKKHPDLNKDGYICFDDLRKISNLRFEHILKKEKGALSELDKEVLQSLKSSAVLTENVNEEFEEKLTIGEKIADKIAKFGGSWTFIISFVLVLLLWIAINTFQYVEGTFDPYPFILLNLVLSCLAALQAPVIMMSQNRHAAKDRLAQENDYQTNLKAELLVRQINTRLEIFMKHNWHKMNEITQRLESIDQDIEDITSNH